MNIELKESNVEVKLEIQNEPVKVIKGEWVQKLLESNRINLYSKVVDLVIVVFDQPLVPKVIMMELGAHGVGELLDKFFGTISYVGRLEGSLVYAFADNLWKYGSVNVLSKIAFVSVVKNEDCDYQIRELGKFLVKLRESYRMEVLAFCCVAPLHLRLPDLLDELKRMCKPL